MPLTLRQLEAFHAVMSAGSVSEAGRLLGVSQPAISRMLADLEENAGFPLFRRQGRRLAPTERGRLLHAEVERSLSGLAQIEGVVAGLRSRGEGQLRLAVVPSLVALVSERLVAPFASAHPAASIVIEAPPSLAAIDWASPAQADLGISFEPLHQPGVESVRIGRTEAVGLVARGHRLARHGRPLAPADFARGPFISFRSGSPFRADVDRLFAQAGVARDLRFEARTTAAVTEMVASLGGATIIPCPGPDISADARLVALPLRPGLMSDITIVRPSAPPSALAEAFVTFALAHPVGTAS